MALTLPVAGHFTETDTVAVLQAPALSHTRYVNVSVPTNVRSAEYLMRSPLTRILP